MSLAHLTHPKFVALALAALVALPSVALQAQDADEPITAAISEDDGLNAGPEVRFSFRHAPWEEVLKWIAEVNEVSFNLDYTPPGTLNFVDEDRVYTPAEALDEINGQLLARGFTLVRRYRTLYIIDLEEEIDKKFVSDLLDETPVEQLADRGRFEITKVRFQLKSISTEDAQKQLEGILGPSGSIMTIPAAGQLIVTETGGHLRTMEDILQQVETKIGSQGLRSFRLQNATAVDVLTAARPLLGIEADKNAAEDGSVKISSNAKGNVIYATGLAEKMGLVEQIVKQVDADAAAAGAGAPLQFIVHPVKRADPASVKSVLETLFAGDTRIRLKDQADSIFAQATAEQHMAIRATIKEIEQDPRRIEIFTLRRNSPAIMVALIERMFGVVENSTDGGLVIDATFDPDQLIVNGTAAQIEQIRSLLERRGERIEDYGDSGSISIGSTSRMLPISADALPEVVDRLSKMWSAVGNGNRIRIVRQPQAPLIRVMPHHPDAPTVAPLNDANESDEPADEDVRGGGSVKSMMPFRTLLVSKPSDQITFVDPPTTTVFVAQGEEARSAQNSANTPVDVNQVAEIVITPTADGLAIVSEDVRALDALEDLLRGVGSNASGSKYSAFNLKYVEAEEAKTTLESLFSGGVDTPTSTSNDRSGAIGLMGGGLSTAGAPTIIADKRINRLFVQGTRAQIREAAEYLKIVDVQNGPVDVQTNPIPRFIPVFYSSAESIVTTLNKIYADQIFDPNSRQNQQQQRGGFGGFGRGGGQPAAATSMGDTPKMTIAAEASSNSVVVSAPPQLFRDVEATVRQIDSFAETQPSESYRLETLDGSASPEMLKNALKGAFGDLVITDGSGMAAAGSSTSTSSNASSTNGAGTTQAAAEQRRAQFFQMLRGGGGGGPGGTTGRGGGGGFGGGGFGGRGAAIGGGGGGRGTGGGGGRGR